MVHYYYTAASKEYVYKILLLYESMLRHDKSFKLFIVCLHKECMDIFERLGLTNAVLVSITDLEAWDREFAAIKEKRSTKQYAWAAKPVAALYILEHYSEVDHIVWLDGDTFFLSSPDPIYKEWGEHQVALTEEKFTGKYESTAAIYGFYNTGFMGFKGRETAVLALRYFRKMLIQWNYDEKEQYRWNDQLYVSDWPERFEDIGIIKNCGVNMTPFIFNRLLEEDKCTMSERDGELYMGDVRITLFHFYGFNCFNRREFELCCYTDIYDSEEIEKLYIPYMKEVVRTIDRISELDVEFYKEHTADRRTIRNYYLDKGSPKTIHMGKHSG